MKCICWITSTSKINAVCARWVFAQTLSYAEKLAMCSHLILHVKLVFFAILAICACILFAIFELFAKIWIVYAHFLKFNWKLFAVLNEGKKKEVKNQIHCQLFWWKMKKKGNQNNFALKQDISITFHAIVFLVNLLGTKSSNKPQEEENRAILLHQHHQQKKKPRDKIKTRKKKSKATKIASTK